jgi:hypothetical protein
MRSSFSGAVSLIVCATMFGVSYYLHHRPPELVEFSSAEGKFKVLMPADPMAGSVPVEGIPAHYFASEVPSGSFCVGYAILPISGNETREQIQFALDEGVRYFKTSKAPTASFVSSSHVTLAGKYPGREFRADVLSDKGRKGTLLGRAYIVGKRWYIIGVMGEEFLVNSAEADRFLNSLEVLP